MLRATLLCFALAAPASPGAAETILAARTIRAKSVLTSADVTLTEGEVAGTYAGLDEVIGLEARVALYAGRPIRFEDLGPPAIIARNQTVTLLYRTAILSVAAEGRALGRAGIGDRVRVMNLTSHQIVTGVVRSDGTVDTSPVQLPPNLQE